MIVFFFFEKFHTTLSTIIKHTPKPWVHDFIKCVVPGLVALFVVVVDVVFVVVVVVAVPFFVVFGFKGTQLKINSLVYKLMLQMFLFNT